MESKQYRLLVCKCSVFNPSHVYAVPGDLVTFIADHGKVWIVQDANGKRFSCLIEELVEAAAVLPAIIKPERPRQDTEPANKKKPRQSKTKGPPSSPTLF